MTRHGGSGPIMGWREWLAAPDWGIEAIKAKVDTGARTSSLHAESIELHHLRGAQHVRFTTRPWQRSDADEVVLDVPLVGRERIRSSNGAQELRPIVAMPVVAGDRRWSVPVSLTDRSSMGFRMLLGREAVAGRFLVDPAESYALGRPSREIRRRNRGRTESDDRADRYDRGDRVDRVERTGP